MGFCRRRRSRRRNSGFALEEKEGRTEIRPYLPQENLCKLNLEDVAFPGHDFVEDWVDEEAEQEAGDKAGDDDDGEGLLRVAADTGGHGGGEKAEAGDERGHHDGAKAKERGAQGRVADGFTFQAKLVDVTDENDRGFHGDAEESEQAEDAGDAPGRVGEL